MPPDNQDPDLARKRRLIDTFRELVEDDLQLRREAIQALGLSNLPNTHRHVAITTMPYYKEVYAMEMKTVLDMMEKHTPKANFIYRYSAYPHLKPSSLYLRINQSLSYLLKHLDPMSKYAGLWSQIRIDTKSNKAGVLLKWASEESPGNMIPEPLKEDEMMTQYMEEIEQFLNNPKEAVLHIKNLTLSTEEIQRVESSLFDLTDVHSVVTEREVKIVKSDFQKEGSK